MDAIQFWNLHFNDSSLSDKNMPKIEVATGFWLKVFPPLSLISKNINNDDQYWKKIHRIMTTIMKNEDVPSPFQRPKNFIEYFYRFVKMLDLKSIDQLILLLDFIPKVNDPLTVLWEIPELYSNDNPGMLLILLDALKQMRHEIWTNIVNHSNLIDDLVIDRIAPYIFPMDQKASAESKYHCSIAISILADLFVNNPRFPDPFESLLTRLLNVMKNGCLEIGVQCFRSIKYILETIHKKIPSANLTNYVKDFADAAVSVPYLKKIIGPALLSMNFPGISTFYVINLLLQNKPDHNDFAYIAQIFSSVSSINSAFDEEIKPESIALQLLISASTDVVFCTTIIKIIPMIKKLYEKSIPSICLFIKNAVGFVIIARSNSIRCPNVSMILDIFRCLNDLGYDWLRNEVANAASILLASQKVPLAIVNALKPSIYCNKNELSKWEQASKNNNTIPNINSLLLNPIKEEPSLPKAPTPPKVRTRNQAPRNIGKAAIPIAPIQKPKSKARIREVTKPLIKNSQSKFLRSYRSNQS